MIYCKCHALSPPKCKDKECLILSLLSLLCVAYIECSSDVKCVLVLQLLVSSLKTDPSVSFRLGWFYQVCYGCKTVVSTYCHV